MNKTSIILFLQNSAELSFLPSRKVTVGTHRGLHGLVGGPCSWDADAPGSGNASQLPGARAEARQGAFCAAVPRYDRLFQAQVTKSFKLVFSTGSPIVNKCESFFFFFFAFKKTKPTCPFPANLHSKKLGRSNFGGLTHVKKRIQISLGQVSQNNVY